MQLDRYLAESRIIDIESDDLRGAIEELVGVSASSIGDRGERCRVVDELIKRENTMSTYLGNGIVIPHLRMPMSPPFLFAIGRCRNGLQYQGKNEYREVRLVVLLLAEEKEKRYLDLLSDLARRFQEPSIVTSLVEECELSVFREKVVKGLGDQIERPELRQSRLNQLIMSEAQTIAKEAKCTAAIVFGDTMEDGLDSSEPFPQMRTIRVRETLPGEGSERAGGFDATIAVKSFSNQRLSQLRGAILVGLTRGILQTDDRICCVGGLPGSNQFDTLMVINVDKEFDSLFTGEGQLLPKGVDVTVIERILAIAAELAVEGREGRPVGCLFVVGDTENVNRMVTPLVLNPFHGHKEEDRNILNPFMHETIKEFSSLDGAFIIRGDGVVETAGSLVHAPSDSYRDMPSGLGSRHSAASAISMATECICIVVSASGGQVSLFRNGVLLPLISKSVDSAI